MKTNKPLVIDSSVAVKWLNKQDEKHVEQADKILEDVQSGKASLVMPELAKYEIGNALLNKQMSLNDTLGSVATYYGIPIQFVPQDQAQAQETIKIAFNNKITYYDASFLALAKKQQADLITDNPKHQNKFKQKEVKVIPLKNYK